MKRIFGPRSGKHLARVSVLLLIVALIAGVAGCTDGYTPPSKDLEIRTWYDLDDVRDNLAGHHILMNDLDSTTVGYDELASPTANGGKGWEPIGNWDVGAFNGTLDGQGHEIKDLFINRPEHPDVGLLGYLGHAGIVEDVRVVSVTVLCGSYPGGLEGVGERALSDRLLLMGPGGGAHIGALVGSSAGTVRNCYSAGTVSGVAGVGGLVGENDGIVSNSCSTADVIGAGWSMSYHVGGLVGENDGTLTSSYASGNVTGEDHIGGLIGHNWGTVSDSRATGSAAGHWWVGGLLGSNDDLVSRSYATGDVTGTEYVGGLTGDNLGTMSDCYAIGNVTAYQYVGGLTGLNLDRVSDCYSSCNVTGYEYVGGLVGSNHHEYYPAAKGTVTNSYSAGMVAGNSSVGGLVGFNFEGTISQSFWDTETSGQATSDGGTGETTAQMQEIATFSGAGWNITAVALNETNLSYIWNIVNNVTYPFLSWQSI